MKFVFFYIYKIIIIWGIIMLCPNNYILFGAENDLEKNENREIAKIKKNNFDFSITLLTGFAHYDYNVKKITGESKIEGNIRGNFSESRPFLGIGAGIRYKGLFINTCIRDINRGDCQIKYALENDDYIEGHAVFDRKDYYISGGFVFFSKPNMFSYLYGGYRMSEILFDFKGHKFQNSHSYYNIEGTDTYEKIGHFLGWGYSYHWKYCSFGVKVAYGVFEIKEEHEIIEENDVYNINISNSDNYADSKILGFHVKSRLSDNLFCNISFDKADVSFDTFEETVGIVSVGFEYNF